jgi:DNA-binding NarL/FixJ family response regulator
MKKRTIYICDDHLLFLESMAAYISVQESYSYIGHAETIEQAKAHLTDLQPDIILIDYHLHSANGLDLLRFIRETNQHSHCYILTMRRDVGIRNLAKKLGANGYMLKTIGANEMIDVFNRSLSGEIDFFDSLEQDQTVSVSNEQQVLTSRELQIAKMVCQQMSTEGISKELGLSVLTVSTHRRNLLNKIEGKNPIDIMNYLKKFGLLMDEH